MTSASSVAVPLPPEGLWAHNAALTLALEAVPAGARAYLGAARGWRPALVVDGVDPDRYAASLLERVREGAGRLGAQPVIAKIPGVTRHDTSKYIVGVAEALCRPGLAASSATLDDLAAAAAGAIAGACGRAWDRVHPVSLALAEFYEFARGYGGSISTSQTWKSSRLNEMPALAQALGLLGHVYTMVYRLDGGRESVHYALAGIPGDMESYKALASRARLLTACAFNALNREDPPHPVQLLAVAAAAAASEAEAGRLPGLLAARLSYRRTVSVQRVDPLAAGALYRVLEGAARSLWGDRGLSTLWRTLASALAARPIREGEDGAGALARCTNVAAPPAGLDQRARARYAAKARRYISALREYSYHLTVYSETVASGSPARDYAYTAARLMHAVASELAGVPGMQGWRRLRGLAWVSRNLARLASRAALAEAPAIL